MTKKRDTPHDPVAVAQEPPASNPRSARPPDREATGRAERVPLGGHRAKLAAPERPGYHRRWINDDGDRIAQALAGDYQFVEDESEVDEAGRGAKRSVIVGTKADGTPMHGYLMEIRQEFFDQDQGAKQSKIAEVEDAITRGEVEGTNPEEQAKFYVPEGGMSIRS